MLPGAQTLSTTLVADVRHILQTGYVNVHTLQGKRCTCPPTASHSRQTTNMALLARHVAKPQRRARLLTIRRFRTLMAVVEHGAQTSHARRQGTKH